MLVDSHCHLHDNFPIPVEEALKKSHQNGVDKIIVIGTSPADSENACKFAEKHEEVSWTYGYHPESFDNDRAKLESYAKTKRVNLAMTQNGFEALVATFRRHFNSRMMKSWSVVGKTAKREFYTKSPMILGR